MPTARTTTAAVGSPIESFGGTSESAPLTSGAAALVIQAYRSTHNGARPSPALVKQLIMSTATDLGAPAFEQGAGLINSLAAVNAALSIRDSNGAPTARGESVLSWPTASAITGNPNAPRSQTYTITNTGTSAQHLSPTLQRLGAPIAGATLNVTLNPATDPTFANSTGALRSYVIQKFNVPAGADHLDASFAFQSPAGTAPIASSGADQPGGQERHLFDPAGHWQRLRPCRRRASARRQLDGGRLDAPDWRDRQLTGPGAVHLGGGEIRQLRLGHAGELDLAPGASRQHHGPVRDALDAG